MSHLSFKSECSALCRRSLPQYPFCQWESFSKLQAKGWLSFWCSAATSYGSLGISSSVFSPGCMDLWFILFLGSRDTLGCFGRPNSSRCTLYNGWDPMLGITSKRASICCCSSIKGLTVLLRGKIAWDWAFPVSGTIQTYGKQDLQVRNSGKGPFWVTEAAKSRAGDSPCAVLSLHLRFSDLIPGGCGFVIQKLNCCCSDTPNPPGKRSVIISRRNIVKSVYKSSYWDKLTLKKPYSLCL